MKEALDKALEREFEKKPAADFLAKLANLVLENKFLYFPDGVRCKVDSLSTGEKIATDAANILREELWHAVVSLESFKGLAS